MKCCKLHKPRVIRVRGLRALMHCDRCGCYQWVETDEPLSVGDRFRWKDVS